MDEEEITQPDYLFSDPDLSPEQVKKIEIAKKADEIAQGEIIERGRRTQALIDSPVWKDLLLIIRKLKGKASDEARAMANPGILYGSDFLEKFVWEVMDSARP